MFAVLLSLLCTKTAQAITSQTLSFYSSFEFKEQKHSHVYVGDTLLVYKKSLDLILTSEIPEVLPQRRKPLFVVSCKLISFWVYEFFFEKELKQLADTSSLRKPKVRSDYYPSKMHLLNTLNKRKRGNILLSFSQIHNGFFFVELVSLRKKGNCYSSKSVFGETYVYMFQAIDGRNVNLVKMKRFD